MTEARGKLAALYRGAPKSTARIEVQETVVVAMECIGLLLFQIAAVLAITTLARERRFRLAAEAWHPFGVGRGSASASVTPPAKTDPANDAKGSNVVTLPPARRPGQGEDPKPKRAKSRPRGGRQALGRVPQFSSVEQSGAMAKRSAGPCVTSKPRSGAFLAASARPLGKALNLTGVVPSRLGYNAAPLLFERTAPLPPRACVSGGRPKGRCRQSINVNPFGVSRAPKGVRAPRFFIRR